MRKAILLLSFLPLFAFSSNGQIVINEIIPPGTVEIVSQGATPVNLNSFWLGSAPNYMLFTDLTIVCGDQGLILEQNEILVLEGFNFLNGDDGELGIYLANDFDDPDDIIDFVEWGSSDHTGSNIAQQAGLWTTGDFVPAWGTCASLEYEGTGNASQNWTPTLNDTECAPNALESCGLPTCELDAANLTNVQCNHNSTFDVPGDDYITFNLNPTGSLIAAAYQVTVTPGSIQPTTGSYGQQTTFQMQNGSAGGGNVTLTITDNNDPNCGLIVNIGDPGACSANCGIFDPGLFNVDCNDNNTPFDFSDDRILFSLDPTGFNLGSGYEIFVENGDANPEVGNYESITNFTLQPGSAGGGDVNITIADLDQPSCTTFFTIEDPGPCSLCLVEGGNISTADPTTFCAGDGMEDILNVQIIGEEGANSAWIITNTSDEILQLPLAPPFNFEAPGSAVRRIYHISYEDGLDGLEIGMDLDDLDGCHDLSNMITVTSKDPVVSSISTEDETTVCSGDGTPDLVNVQVSGGQSEFTSWIFTDNTGVILDLPTGTPFNFENDGPPLVRIWYINYESGLTGLEIGNNISQISGCFHLSNTIIINRQQPEGGVINTNSPTTICVDDGTPDIVEVSVSNQQGAQFRWLVTNQLGFIESISGAPPFNFEGTPIGVAQIYHLSYYGFLSGLTVGENVLGLIGCYAFSNPILITRIGGEDCISCDVDGGNISATSSTVICKGDAVPDQVNISLENAEGPQSSWIIANGFGQIQQLPSGPPFNFTNSPPGVYLIYHINYESPLNGLAIGELISELDGCFDLSNGVSIEVVAPDGGTISTSSMTTVCTDDGLNDNITGFLTGGSASFQAWFITNAANQIIALPSGPPFNLEGTGAGGARIWHIGYETGFAGLEIGANTAFFTGCYDLSNSIDIIRQTGKDCISGINNPDIAARIDIIPNPAIGSISFVSDFPVFEEITILDLTGRLMSKHQNIASAQGLEISALGSGVYYLVIKVGDSFAVKKLVKL